MTKVLFRQARTDVGLTQLRLAANTDVSVSTIYRADHGIPIRRIFQRMLLSEINILRAERHLPRLLLEDIQWVKENDRVA